MIRRAEPDHGTTRDGLMRSSFSYYCHVRSTQKRHEADIMFRYTAAAINMCAGGGRLSLVAQRAVYAQRDVKMLPTELQG